MSSSLNSTQILYDTTVYNYMNLLEEDKKGDNCDILSPVMIRSFNLVESALWGWGNNEAIAEVFPLLRFFLSCSFSACFILVSGFTWKVLINHKERKSSVNVFVHMDTSVIRTVLQRRDWVKAHEKQIWDSPSAHGMWQGYPTFLKQTMYTSL